MASSRSSSEERIACRSSAISSSFMSLRDHWMAPMPMHSRARPSVTPSATLEAPKPRIRVGLVADVEDEVGDAEQDRDITVEKPKRPAT